MGATDIAIDGEVRTGIPAHSDPLARSTFKVPPLLRLSLPGAEPSGALRILLSASRVHEPDGTIGEESVDAFTLEFGVREPGLDQCIETKQRAMTLLLSTSQLRALLGDHPMPSRVRRFLDGDPEPFSMSGRATQAMRRIWLQLEANPYSGAASQFFVQGRLYDLLAEFASQWTSAAPARPILPRDRQLAHAARELLCADLSRPPPIDQLARTVGLSPRRLNELFRLLFGDSVFGCFTTWRLERAHALLTEGMRSVKEIAYQLGYAHPSNFVLAFSRQFGESPGRFQRRVR